MPISVRQRRFAIATGLLLAVAVSLSGCASTPEEASRAADQKAYGAKMAQQGFWREALFRFERAAKIAPDDPEVLNNLAVACEATGETARALAAYKRALELRPDDSRIKRNYARFAEYYTSLQRASGPTATPK
ncbi:MAG: tetratricopeptide repeat protein [Thermoanaerobaculia bacterium]|nr:tetratricopeptide repeat protein [Thermoanaerobaculia bacterium]